MYLRLAFLFTLLWNSGAVAQTLLDAEDSGRYSIAGFHDPADTEYQAIVGGTRSFFVFDLSNLPSSEPIASATLILQVGGVSQGTFGGISYTLFSVSTPTATLTAGGSSLVGIYTDLGTGDQFSAVTDILPTDQATLKSIPLLAAGLGGLEAARGDVFAVGGSPSGLGGNRAFDGTNVTGAELVIEFAPAAVGVLSLWSLAVLSVALIATTWWLLRGGSAQNAAWLS